MREAVELHSRKGFTKKQAAEIFLAAGGICKICKEKIFGKFEVEHRVPLALSGTNDPSNLEPAHIDCHAGKTKDDQRAIAKAKRNERKSDKKTRKPATMKSRGFQKTLTKGFDGRVRPR